MILIQNAHIKPIVGPELPNGCLLAEDGRITAVAPHIDAPEGCTVIDAGGRLLTPGCVEAHCHIGLDNECLRWEGMDYNEIVDPLTPQLRAIDSINPQDGAFPNALRGGVTTACTGPGSANRRRYRPFVSELQMRGSPSIPDGSRSKTACFSATRPNSTARRVAVFKHEKQQLSQYV